MTRSIGIGSALAITAWLAVTGPGPAHASTAPTPDRVVEPEIDEIDEIDEVTPAAPEIDETAPAAPEIDEAAPAAPEIDEAAPAAPEIDEAAPVDPEIDEIDEAAATDRSAPSDRAAEPTTALDDPRAPPPTPPSESTRSPPQPAPSSDAPHPPDAPASEPSTARTRLRALLDHFRFGGFVQVDFLRRQISEDELSDGTREPLNETAFVLRNARVGVDADWRYVGTTASAELFSNGGPVRPATFDLHAQIPRRDPGAPPWVQLRTGLLRVPFGFENFNQNDAQRFFGERTLVSHAYVPGLFDVGASLEGQLWALRWIVGVYNGQPVGAPGFGYRDPNAAKDYAGRLHLRGLLPGGIDAALGTSFLYGTGFSAGTPPSKDSFDWIDLNEDGRVTVAEIIPVTGSAGRPSENFSRWGLGVDTQLRRRLPRVGLLTLYAEMAVGENLDRAVAIADPVLLRRDQRGLGWYVGLTQQLTRHATIGVRYDQYHPDLDRIEPYEGTTVITRRRFQTVSGGVAGHLHQGEAMAARLLVEYEHQRNSLGRDAQGRPAQLDNDTLRVRAEVVF